MNLLTIGGSDPSSGAGIQGDVRTFSSLGAYPLTVITSITSQNTSNFQFSEPVSEKMIKQQIASLMLDFKIDGIKVGMVYDSTRIKAIYKQLHKTKIPIVLDPVIKSTTGGVLLKKSSLEDFKEFLIPLSYVITPNKYEAELLSNTKITSQKTLFTAAKKIQGIGSTNVIITGVKQKGKIVDFVLEGNKHYQIPGKKISIESHGGGCTYSSAILFSICKGNSLLDSAKFSKKFTVNSIKDSKKIGRGIPITSSHQDKIMQELTEAIQTFQTLPKVYEKIPECQTNFVFSKTKPNTPNDVLGVSGRIVKNGKKVTRVGELLYGASKHVATALIEVNKKYPQIRSAINLRYQKETLSKFKKSGFNILNYDRTKEPNKVKKTGSSVKWGINYALQKSQSAPDVIYHMGDFGKEPMILVFAESPKQVIKKISKLK